MKTAFLVIIFLNSFFYSYSMQEENGKEENEQEENGDVVYIREMLVTAKKTLFVS